MGIRLIQKSQEARQICVAYGDSRRERGGHSDSDASEGTGGKEKRDDRDDDG
jgi:hypothetical protein